MARVLISMKDEFLELIDEVAESEHRSRSELIREALRTYIRKNPSAGQKLDRETAKALEALIE
jgi:metal-responsive CopG/Arc/MetJ family transcriptional regulator